MTAQAQIITPTVVKEITNDAIEPIWIQAKNWHEQYHLYAGFGQQWLSTIYSHEPQQVHSTGDYYLSRGQKSGFITYDNLETSIAYSPIIDMKVQKWTLAYLIDGAVIAILMQQLMNMIHLSWFSLLIGAATAYIYMFAMSCINNTRLQFDGIPFRKAGIAVNIIFHMRLMKLKWKKYSQTEIINICRAFLSDSIDKDVREIERIQQLESTQASDHAQAIGQIRKSLAKNQQNNEGRDEFFSSNLTRLTLERKKAKELNRDAQTNLEDQLHQKNTLNDTLDALAIMLEQFDEISRDKAPAKTQSALDVAVLENTQAQLNANMKQLQQAIDEVYEQHA